MAVIARSFSGYLLIELSVGCACKFASDPLLMERLHEGMSHERVAQPPSLLFF